MSTGLTWRFSFWPRSIANVAQLSFLLASLPPFPQSLEKKQGVGHYTVFDLWIVVQERIENYPFRKLPTMPFLSGSEPDEPFFPRLVKKVVKVPRQARKAASSIVSRWLISLAARYL